MDLIQPCSQNVCFLCGVGRHPETEMGWFMSSYETFCSEFCCTALQRQNPERKAQVQGQFSMCTCNHATYTKCSCWILVFLLGDCQSIMELVELTEYDHLKQLAFKMFSSQEKVDFMLYIHTFMHFLTGSILLPSVHMCIQSEIISLSVGYFDMKSEKRSRTTWYR